MRATITLYVFTWKTGRTLSENNTKIMNHKQEQSQETTTYLFFASKISNLVWYKGQIISSLVPGC